MTYQETVNSVREKQNIELIEQEILLGDASND